MEDVSTPALFGTTPSRDIITMEERKKKLDDEMDTIWREMEAECAELLQVQHDLETFALSIIPIVPIAPIHQVSDDILLYIFFEYLNTGYVQSCLVSLTSVCRRWHTIVTRNPQLWNRIQLIPWQTIERTRNQLKYIDIAMKRTRQLPLDVEIIFAQEQHPLEYTNHVVTHFARGYFPHVAFLDWEALSYPRTSPFVHQFDHLYLELIKKLVETREGNMRRWRSAHITLPFESYKNLWSLFTGETPNLVTLRVECPLGQFHSFSPQKMKSFPQLPSLQELHIPRNVHLSSFNTNSMSINHLTIYEVDGWLNLRQLHLFSALRSLQYHGRHSISPPEPTIDVDTRIYLPHLQSLTLHMVVPPSLLLYFDVPLLSELSLSGHFQRFDEFPITPLLALPQSIALEGGSQDLSQSHLTQFFETFLPQCTSLVNLTTPKDLEDIVIAYLDYRKYESSPTDLPTNLRSIYRGRNHFSEREISTLVWNASTGRINIPESE
jgi:hypothetical protein